MSIKKIKFGRKQISEQSFFGFSREGFPCPTEICILFFISETSFLKVVKKHACQKTSVFFSGVTSFCSEFRKTKKFAKCLESKITIFFSIDISTFLPICGQKVFCDF